MKSRCSRTGKIIFPTFDEAQRWLLGLYLDPARRAAAESRYAMPKRVIECQWGDHWHVTSQDKKGGR